jgi:hypothetical protein
MGRKAKLTQTVLKFIARDDSAIDLPEEEVKEAYEKFLTEQNLKGLKVNEAEGPAWYQLRPFRTENWGEVVEAYAAVAEASGALPKGEEGEQVDEAIVEAVEALEDGDKAPPTSDEVKELMKTHRHHVREAVRDRIVGVVRHPIVVSVSDEGEADIRIVTWEVGTPQPEGLVEDILSQDPLVADMFMFLLYSAMLTERKKKL